MSVKGTTLLVTRGWVINRTALIAIKEDGGMRGRFASAVCSFAVLASTATTGNQHHPTLMVDRAEAGAAAVDARFGSPRATLRTFYSAISASREHTSRLATALMCMDLRGTSQADAGRLAIALDTVLRAADVRSYLVADVDENDTCTLADHLSIRIVMTRDEQGRWRFDAETVGRIPAMRRAVWQLADKQAANESAAPVELHSPRATVQTFLDSLRRGDVNGAAGCLDLSEVLAPARPAVGPELAVKIQEVLDRIGLVVEQDLSDHGVGEPVVLAAERGGRIALARVAAGERAGQWLFDRATVRSIESLYDMVADRPLADEVVRNGRSSHKPPLLQSLGLWVRHAIPALLKAPIPGLRHWRADLYQAIGLLAIALVMWYARSTCVSLAERVLFMALRRAAEDERRHRVAAIAPAAAACLLCEAAALGVCLFDLRGSTAAVVFTTLSIVRCVAWAWLGCGLVGLFSSALVAWRTRRGSRAAVSAMLLPLVALVMRIVIGLVSLAIILQTFDVHVTTILAGLGVGGLACALAAQDTLKNLFGSVTLIADRTFFAGDWIKIGETEGMVESVGLRSTRIRSIDDAVLTIPNAELTTMHITNYGARRYRAAVSVLYSTPPERLIAFRDGIVQIIESHAHTIKHGYDVRVHDLSSSSIDLLVTVFFRCADNLQERAARERLIVEIVRLAPEVGVEFAFPTQTLHIASGNQAAIEVFRPACGRSGALRPKTA